MKTPHTLFIRHGKITPQEKMHLQVDHGIEEVDLDEDNLIEAINPYLRKYKQTAYGTMVESERMTDIARAIINHITEQE